MLRNNRKFFNEAVEFKSCKKTMFIIFIFFLDMGHDFFLSTVQSLLFNR